MSLSEYSCLARTSTILEVRDIYTYTHACLCARENIYIPVDAPRPPTAGTPFDPLQLGGPFSEDDIDKAISYEKYRVAEIKHGRVSMIAFLGMAIQAAVTGDGPLRNLEQALDQLVQK